MPLGLQLPKRGGAGPVGWVRTVDSSGEEMHRLPPQLQTKTATCVMMLHKGALLDVV